MEEYKHYIRVDDEQNVIYAFSDAFEQPVDGDILFATGERHFNPDLWYKNAIPRWHVVDGEMTERSDEELVTLWGQYQEDHPRAKMDVEKIADLEQLVADLASLQLGV